MFYHNKKKYISNKTEIDKVEIEIFAQKSYNIIN